MISIVFPNSFAETVSIQTNKEYFLAGDKVEIFGTVQGGKKGDLVGFEIKNPNGDTILIRTISLNADSTFDLKFKLPKSGIDGEYVITTNLELDGKKISETKYLNQGIPTLPDNGGGCLIATAAYGSELAPQVQFLREIRDVTLLSTTSGATFMTGFNQFYYSFSPTIANWERENPVFQQAVKALITPMISTLSIMTLADEGSEASILGWGISVIALNLGLYIAAPAAIAWKVNRYLKSRKYD